jgi:hypothetical protein
MLTRFVCLANSFKEGGRCLAGIELDADDNPVIISGRPKWIRPVCHTEHGEVPNHTAAPFQILDIVELDVTEPRPDHYQSENILFNEGSIRTIGGFSRSKLRALCENPNYIFATPHSSLTEEAIKDLTFSLLLIKPEKFEVVQKVYEDSLDKPKQRLVFHFNGFDYDFSITDPVFLRNYKRSAYFTKRLNEVALCLSVGIKFPKTNKHYKLVAGIISL